MRCPKCQYIGLGETSRCRNCGYDFSLSAAATAPLDLTVRDEAPGPPVDLPLDQGTRRASIGGYSDALAAREPAGPAADLPLFTDGDDVPLVTPAVPRAPLAVRRPAPVPRPRRSQDPRDPGLNLEPPLSSSADPAVDRAGTESDAIGSPASAVSRLAGGLIDAIILLSIDAAVVYLTLRVSDLESSAAMQLLSVPMVAFLLLLNGGYVVLFTAAGGQTIGKMAAGTRVVLDTPDERGRPERVTFHAATLRGAAYLASLLPAGLGFLPIVFSDDGRALHDRLAHTRVIRA